MRHRPDDPLAALIFKVVAERPVDLFFIRIYSGTLRAGVRLLNANTGKKENITQIYRIFAKHKEQISDAVAGQIVAVVGAKDSLTGHTLCDPRRPVLLEQIRFPDTVISRAVEPKSSADREKMMEALAALARQDPTFQFTTSSDSGQVLVSGMGELHLEVLLNRLLRDMRVDVSVGKPRVSYREAVGAHGEGTGSFIRQAGGRGHFAVVTLAVEPHVGDDPYKIDFENRLGDQSIDPRFVPAIFQGAKDAATSGELGGYPMINLRVILLNAQQHDADSSELAFENAARMAFGQAVRAAGPVLMEPIMKVEIHTPDAYFGSISGDLTARRAMVTHTDTWADQRIIEVEAPLSEMFGYVTTLRSLSQGRAQAAMEPSHYAPVPAHVAKVLLGL